MNPQYQKIWNTVTLIPRGKVASYGQVADLAGLPNRARLVGKCLKCIPENKLVPWYRVLRSTGQIAFPSGSEQAKKQRDLLMSEGVLVLNNRVKMRNFQWEPSLNDILYGLTY